MIIVMRASKRVPCRSFLALARDCLDLRSLHCSCMITDRGLIQITRRCFALRSLEIDAWDVTDAAIATLPNLEHFVLRNNECVTIRSIIHFIKRSPDLQLIFAFNCTELSDSNGHCGLLMRIEDAGEADAIAQKQGSDQTRRRLRPP